MLFATVLVGLARSQQSNSFEVEFFYSAELDTCSYGDISNPANGNTANGGICAYTPSTNRLYACPAPDKYGRRFRR
jgi:hypothetical protein